MNEPRIIKKYPNRRLYDTAISSYITLEDVRRLVIEQIPIKVVDARSQEDITHSTLLQIIIEQEESGPPLFTIDSLQKMIRSYGGAMQTFLSKIFEQGMDVYAEQQSLFKGNAAASVSQEDAKDPVRLMTDIAQRNVAHWQQLQQQWLNNFGGPQSSAAEAVPASERVNEDTHVTTSVKTTE
ncbi:MAG: polyhydroxyalkanoate synthesis repressor PhaR [Gammaproteobacteria bacterium 39-13]|nr:polyhydroxyalkanoate synthesis repressor PhaR [Gammaproteobacteria bacterium]OJV88087.1 MAG: polyhydroxyalkanoate synthesis repressor PhaR [Gammaproteobacteria bacterium 39-13]